MRYLVGEGGVNLVKEMVMDGSDVLFWVLVGFGLFYLVKEIVK